MGQTTDKLDDDFNSMDGMGGMGRMGGANKISRTAIMCQLYGL